MRYNILIIATGLMIVFMMPMTIYPKVGPKCYHQKPGWRFWEQGQCKNPDNFCVSIKNCPIGELLIDVDNGHMEEIGQMLEMGPNDEVRGCVRIGPFCDNKQLAGCDCRTCHWDLCNAALSQQKMAIGVVIMLLALTMAIPICGFLGHLFVPQNLLMMIGDD